MGFTPELDQNRGKCGRTEVRQHRRNENRILTGKTLVFYGRSILKFVGNKFNKGNCEALRWRMDRHRPKMVMWLENII